MYYIFLIIILLFAIYEVVTNKRNKLIFDVLFVGLTIMLCLRYGQGQDYFSYMYIYYNEPFYNYKEVLSTNDIGFYSLSFLCGTILSLDFEWFVAIIGIISMSLFYRFFTRECEYSILSLFGLYCTAFIVYMTSAMRQGLAMSIYVAFALPYLYEKKWTRYILIVLLCASFHASALILLIAPLFYSMDSRLLKITIIITSLVLMFLGATFFDSSTVNAFLADADHDKIEENTQWVSKIMRTIYMLPILFIVYNVKNEQLQRQINLFICILVIYAVFSFMNDIATRLWGYALPFFWIILSLLKQDKLSFRKNVCHTWYIVLVIMLFFNTLYNDANSYKHGVTMWTFPYFSVFEKQEVHQHMQYYNYLGY